MYREYKDQNQYDVPVMVHIVLCLELQIFNYWSLRETPLSHMRMFMYNILYTEERAEYSMYICADLRTFQ